MAGKMTVHLFSLDAHKRAMPLEDALHLIEKHSLGERVRDVSGNNIRLENIILPNSAGNASRYWLLNFTKFRFENCPGKVGKLTPIEGFDLKKDEGFGEETAVLFDPKSKYLIIQYHHSGVRANAIKDYLSDYFHDGNEVTDYELKIKLDPTSEIKLAQKKFISRVKLKIAPSEITPEFRKNNLTLGQVLDFNDKAKSKEIELIIAAPRKENLSKNFVNSMINYLRDLRQSDLDNETSAIKKFEVSGREEVDGRTDAINMLAPKLKLVIDGLMVGGDRRYTVVSRWDGLQRAANGWKEHLN